MSVQCTSGPATVVGHGEVTTFFGEDLRLALDLGGSAFAVTMRFAAADAPEVDTTPTDGGVTMTLRGFDDVSGRGSAQPALLGELGDELLFLHFRVFRWGQTTDRTVHYCFFRVRKDDVGWQPMIPEEST